jgi:hypothetical protein
LLKIEKWATGLKVAATGLKVAATGLKVAATGLKVAATGLKVAPPLRGRQPIFRFLVIENSQN